MFRKGLFNKLFKFSFAFCIKDGYLFLQNHSAVLSIKYDMQSELGLKNLIEEWKAKF